MSQSDLNTVIKQITETINTNCDELVEKIKAIVDFIIKIEKDQYYCYIDLKNKKNDKDRVSVSNTNIEKSDCTITMNSTDFISFFNGKLNPQQAFMQGKMKIKGNMRIAQNLHHLIDKVNSKKL